MVCPQLRVGKLWPRRWNCPEEPLLPRYLLVGTSDERSRERARSTMGLVAPLRFGGQVPEAPSTGGDPA